MTDSREVRQSDLSDGNEVNVSCTVRRQSALVLIKSGQYGFQVKQYDSDTGTGGGSLRGKESRKAAGGQQRKVGRRRIFLM